MSNSSKLVRMDLFNGVCLKVPPMMVERIVLPRAQIENRMKKLVLNPDGSV